MARLIDADELKTAMDECIYSDRDRFSTGYAKSFIDNAPTVDAVPVVRCKDCKYYLHSNEKCELIDTRLHFYETRNRWTDDDFCSWGERKGGADDADS